MHVQLCRCNQRNGHVRLVYTSDCVSRALRRVQMTSDGSRIVYACDCVSGALHSHDATPELARVRGVHDDGTLWRAAATADPATEGLFAAGVADAVEGALYGALIGDALAAPLHWVYDHAALRALREEHFPGGRDGYAATPPTMQHPNSHSYFSRCDPTREPVDVFGGPEAAKRWAVPGTPYHGSLAAGDNTLTGRLLAGLVATSSADARVDAPAWLRAYSAALVQREGPAAHTDDWTDETHRVLFANLARGALPGEAGMEDACLSALVLALPALLLYAFNRDAAALGVRVTSQLTHKSDAAARDALWLGDLLALLIAPHVGGGCAGGGGGGAPLPPSKGGLVQEALAAACTSFSEGRTDLRAVLAAFPPERQSEEAFFGPSVVFSSR